MLNNYSILKIDSQIAQLFKINNNVLTFNNQIINSSFLFFKEIEKNYLFGYNLSINTQNFDSTYFGSAIILNYRNTTYGCKHCKNGIIFTPIFNGDFYKFYSSAKCSKCGTDNYNYNLFPELFKDYKG